MIRMSLVEVMSNLGKTVYKTTLGSGMRCLPSGDTVLKAQKGLFIREQRFKEIIAESFHAGESLVAWGEIGRGPQPDNLEQHTATIMAKIKDLK